MLEVAPTPDGPFTLVQPTGPDAPTHRLRYHTLITGTFELRGHLTGTHVDDHHCGAWPELHVTSFEPWGTIKRCTSIGGLYDQLHLYTEDQPTDHYVPADFTDGPDLPLIDADACTPKQDACEDGLKVVRGCDETVWCCPVGR